MRAPTTATTALASMRIIADQAAVRMRYNVGEPATTKPDGTPVTPSDLVINELVAARLRLAHPNAGLLGEEGSFDTDAGRLFVVDPIDGTAAYCAGLGVASFVMAYAERGVTRVALIEDPYTATRFEAELGAGARVNGDPLVTPPESRSSIVLYEALRASELDELTLIVALRRHGANPVHYLSFASVAARVATGALAGAVFARPSLWDCLAPALIASEAGASVTTLRGAPVTGTDLCDGIILAHPTWHARIVAAVAESYVA